MGNSIHKEEVYKDEIMGRRERKNKKEETN